jgi:hypothetical protein
VADFDPKSEARLDEDRVFDDLDSRRFALRVPRDVRLGLGGLRAQRLLPELGRLPSADPRRVAQVHDVVSGGRGDPSPVRTASSAVAKCSSSVRLTAKGNSQARHAPRCADRI